MAMPLKPLTVQRLAYVRYLYREGVEQSQQPAPLRARAITSFHDAVENFIGLTAEHLGVDLKPRTEFLQYWEFIKPEYELPKKTEMKRLNDVRIALKHNGTFPSSHQIEQAREALVDFFTTVTVDVFNVDFDSIDMADLITQPKVAQYLKDAQTHADVGDYSMAAAGLSIALDTLLRHYARDDGGGRNPFAFGPTLYWHDEPKVRGREAWDRPRLVKLSSIAESTQQALRAMALGIDYPKLVRFQTLVPTVHPYADGSWRYVEDEAIRQLSPDDYDWARHFVIDSALRASAADAVDDLRKTRNELGRDRPHPERSWTGALQESGSEHPHAEEPPPISAPAPLDT
ncbi:hypothetical protein [Streptomyces rochei]|uniref:hypothetical protein n=1 Tax=Streptomyces rochei TaxID=1928 RepID=UPI0033B11F27